MHLVDSMQLLNKNYDVVVIGLGAVGSATLYQLSKRGVSVLGIDQLDPPHNLGSSHGETRITRLAVGEGEDYVALAVRSLQIWKEIESKSGNQLYHQTGGVLMDSGVLPWDKHGTKSFLDQTISLAKKFNISHRVEDARQTVARFPHILLESTGKSYQESATGYLLPEQCIADQLDLAAKMGADLLKNIKVINLSPLGNKTAIQLNEGKIFAKKIVLAAGGWIKDFLPDNEARKFKVCRQVLHWLAIDSFQDLWKKSPVYMWGIGANPEDFIYGFPSLDGKSVKMASESFVETSHPDYLNREVTADEQQKFWDAKIAGRFMGLSGKFLKSTVCFYTVTTDGRFVVRLLEGFSSVLVVSACSGHGFKHSPALGENLAQQVCGEEVSIQFGPE